jgi:hypothetical protein
MKLIKVNLNTHHALMQIKIDNNFSRIEDAILFLIKKFESNEVDNGFKS